MFPDRQFVKCEAHWKAAKEGEELLRELFNLLRFTSPGKIDRVYNKK